MLLRTASHCFTCSLIEGSLPETSDLVQDVPGTHVLVWLAATAVGVLIPLLLLPSWPRVVARGCGSDNFIGGAPEGFNMVGVEIDSTTARIASKLYPDAKILNESFGDTLTRFVQPSHTGLFLARVGVTAVKPFIYERPLYTCER